jgi:hypothetical protein
MWFWVYDLFAHIGHGRFNHGIVRGTATWVEKMFGVHG